MLWLRIWYRLLTQQHLLGVGGESRKHSGWIATKVAAELWAPLRWGREGKVLLCTDSGSSGVLGRGAESASSEAALSCHPCPACLLPPLLPGSCSTIKVSIAHLKCEMRAQLEEVACSFVPWCMKRPNKMQMDWRRPCGLVATTGSEECEPDSWQYQVLWFCCGAGASPPMRRGAVCFHGPPLWPTARSSLLLEGAAGQACCERWAEVCVSGGTGEKLRSCLPLLLDNSKSP